VDELRLALEREHTLAYALLFGSAARGTEHPASDLDLAVGLVPGARLGPRELGELVSSLEQATGRTIDLVLLDAAPPALAYRVFRDGRVLFARDRRALVARQARAIIEYLDFRPFEQIAVRGVLSAAADGR
jgi:predicted nucleotidyltransferase